MNDPRRWIAAGVAAAAAAVTVFGLSWSQGHQLVRGWMWRFVSTQALTEPERHAVAACEPPSWWVGLKVLGGGLEPACGEAWLLHGLADRLHGQDRLDWMLAWSSDRSLPASLRLRAAWALRLVGEAPGAEPGLLLEQVHGELRERYLGELSAGALEPKLLGPWWSLELALWELEEGADLDEAHLEAVRLAVGLGLHRGRVVGALRGWLQVPEPWPPGGVVPTAVPPGWRRAAERAVACTTRCDEAWLAWAELALRDPEGQGLPADGALPAEEPRLGLLRPLMELEEGSWRAREGVSSWLAATSEWLDDSPDPARSLRALVRRGRGPTTEAVEVPSLMGGGGAPPWLGALWALELGGRVGLEVRVSAAPDHQGVVLHTGPYVYGLAPCGGAVVLAPGELLTPSAPWPAQAVVSAAMAEHAVLSGDPVDALVWARAAERLDAIGAGALWEALRARDGTVVQGPGADLFSREGPAGAEEARRAVARARIDRLGAGCEP